MNLPYEQDVSVHPFQLWEISKFDNLSEETFEIFFKPFTSQCRKMVRHTLEILQQKLQGF